MPFVAALVVLVGMSVPRPAAPATPTFRLTILHTNDLHGRLLPFTYAEQGRGGAEREWVGGAARRATLLRRLRNRSEGFVLTMDAGDVFTRGALTNAYEGLADVAAMNAMGYEVAAVGNNEFKAKDAVDAEDAAGSQRALLRVVRASRFPWVCANLTDGHGRTIPGIRSYVILRRGPLRIGVLGLTAPRSAKYPQTRGWRISHRIQAAREWVPTMDGPIGSAWWITLLRMSARFPRFGSSQSAPTCVSRSSVTFALPAVRTTPQPHQDSRESPP